MIDRHHAGLIPEKPHTAHRDQHGELFYEEMFTRGGFSAEFTYFYHRFPITAHREVTTTDRGFPAAIADPAAAHPLKRRLYDSNKITAQGPPRDRRSPIPTNKDVTVYLARVKEPDSAYFANGDGDELFFIHDGSARLESNCGWLDARAGDYIWVPRSLVHRWHIASPELRVLVFESHGSLHIPKEFRNSVGQLKMDAPYTHRDFVRPAGPIATPQKPQDGPRELFVKKHERFTRYVAERPLMDAVGWDGFVYPVAFNIEKYQPKTGLIHLPPTIHSTFAGHGLLICSFVPRIVDFHPQAIPCPYPHSSVDCDEIILYLRGNFTSRRGVGPGCISLHPAGVAHGPHPGAYEGSIGTVRTDELAVMCDTFAPLLPTAQAANIEDAGYHDSWRAGVTDGGG